MQQEESGSRVRALGELTYSCYAQRFPQYSPQEVQGRHLLELLLRLGLKDREAHVRLSP